MQVIGPSHSLALKTTVKLSAAASISLTTPESDPNATKLLFMLLARHLWWHKTSSVDPTLLLAYLPYSVRLLTRQQKTVFEASVIWAGARADKLRSLKCTPFAPPDAVLWTTAPLHCLYAEGRATICAANRATNKKQNDMK